MFYSTAPAPAQPLMLRIELAIVDESERSRAAESARRIGHDAEAPTPRHPEFEPRNQLTAEADTEPEPAETDTQSEPAVASAEPPEAPLMTPEAAETPTWAAANSVQHVAQQTEERGPDLADVPWVLPAIEASPPPQGDWFQQPQAQLTLDDEPVAAPDLQFAPLADEPLASLPAASSALVGRVAPEPVMPAQADSTQPASVAQPFEQPQPQPQAAPQAARPLAQRSEQPDLWFLASEPEAYATSQPTADATGDPSSFLTVGLTVLMAVVVVGLVLAFLWLMTSLPILR